MKTQETAPKLNIPLDRFVSRNKLSDTQFGVMNFKLYGNQNAILDKDLWRPKATELNIQLQHALIAFLDEQ